MTEDMAGRRPVAARSASQPSEAARDRDRNPAAPFLTLRGVALAGGLAVACCWPIWVTGALFVFPDTTGYLRAGQAAWSFVSSLLPTVAGGGGGALGASGTVESIADGAPVGRSATYGAGAYLAVSALGPWALAVAQAWLVAIFALALIGPSAAGPRLLPLVVWAVALSPVPFYAVFLIPDLLAAVPILFAALLATRFERLGTGWQAALTILAALAVSSHYGTIPLAFGALAAALAVRFALDREIGIRSIASAVVVVGFAPLLNLFASTAALDGPPSVAPLRLPILLARSIEDGPARWHLEAACPEAGYALCDLFEEGGPENVGAFLWSSNGVAGLSAEAMERVRAEEATILMRAFLAHPGAQTWSLLGNAATQAVSIGTDEIAIARGFADGYEVDRLGAGDPAWRLTRAVDAPMAWSFWIATGLAAALALRAGGSREAWTVVGVVAAGLVANAAIFGGLSAPVDRYQSRVAWLLPFALWLAWAGAARRGAAR